MRRLSAFALSLLLTLSMTSCAQRDHREIGVANPSTTPASSAVVAESTADPDIVYITFYREGEGTTIPVTMLDGKDGRYRIATNPEVFHRESWGSSDVFWYTPWDGQPKIYYSVSYHPDTTAEYMKDGLLHQHNGATSEAVKIGQYDATVVRVSKNDQLLTQQHFYLIAYHSGCYVIETQFVFEMYEGLYPQMRALFDTFTIVE